MDELARILEAIDGQWLLAALLRASVQGGAALAIVWLLCRVLPKLPPAWKCWLLRLAYLKLLVAFCGPTPIDLPLLRPEPPNELRRTVAVEPVDHAPILAARPADAPVGWRIRLDDALLALWIAGAGISTVVVAVRWRAAVRLRRRSVPLADSDLLRRYRQVAATFGVRRPPPLLTSDFATGPLLVSLARPAIVLPARLIGTDPARLRLMLAHELAHHRRHDLPWGLLPMAARIGFWFHPIVWLAEREWWLARESASDALALRATGGSPAEYGWALLEAATWAGRAASRFATAGVIESKSTLKRRLSAMQCLPLASRRRWAVIGSALTLASALALVPIRLTAQQPAAHADTGGSHSGEAAATGGAPATASPEWHGALTLPGTVEGRTAAIRPAIDGVISAVKCDIGQSVKQGAPLFELDNRVAAAQLAAAEAQMQNAKATVQQANAGVNKGVVDAGELRKAQAQLEVAEAELQVRQAALNQSRIVAPFGGVIARRDANVGDVVKRGDALATLVQLDPLSVSVSVPQSAYPNLEVGQAARIRADVLGTRSATGTVSFISPQLDPATGTGTVKVAVGNPDGKLKPGMFVT
ncbi:MAG TPA: efflux RND transporter periplasmic adaptor subunit, partial [Tepidisphaeraceae bacterium]